MTCARYGCDKDIMLGDFGGVNQPEICLIKCRLRVGLLPDIRKLRFHFQASNQAEIRRIGDGCGECVFSAKYLESLEWWANLKPASNVKGSRRWQGIDLLVVGDDFDFRIWFQWRQ